MSDSNENKDDEVHPPSPRHGTQTPPPNEPNQPQPQSQTQTNEDEATDLETNLSLEAALRSLPPGDDDLEAQEIDPDTLANLAALSRITNDDDEGGDDGRDGNDELDVNGDHDFANLMGQGSLTGEQVQQIVDSLGDVHPQSDEQEGQSPHSGSGHVTDDDSDREGGNDDGSRTGDEDYRGPKPFYEDGKRKRRRNRTVLSCTECHRRCDRNIPCSRCIKRGVPMMCRMEAPIIPPRKRRKMAGDVTVNHELSMRVQALESLIRSGSTMENGTAQNVAMETIMHATRAANNGQPEAANALAQLTQSANLGVNGMSTDAQNTLLLDVLQQLSAASSNRGQSSSASGSYTEMRDTWSAVPAAPTRSHVQPDASADQADNKLNVALSGFRDEQGKIFHPPTVRFVEKKLREEHLFSHEEIPVQGFVPFIESGTRFAYGEDSAPFKGKRIAAIQAVSVTGGLRLAATFLARFPAIAGQRSIYTPNPTSEEDTAALRNGGLEVKSYRFWDPKTGLVDWEGMREDLQLAPPRSVVLLHIGGSTPTGAEHTAGQWRMLTTLLQERRVIPLVILAFQGLSSGDTNRDAQPLRFMIHEGLPVVLVQGFEATMGLYADSPSIVSIATQSQDDRDRIDSQFRHLSRSMYYRPPALGARIAHGVLSDTKMFPAWQREIKAMSDRLKSVREKLFDQLDVKLKTPGQSWSYIRRSAGMYLALLLPPSGLYSLTTKRNIQLLPDGCISLGCLNAPKIEALAKSIDWVVREGIREAEEQAEQALVMQMALQAAKEQQEREEAEAAAQAEAAAAAAAQAEDTLLMEESIQTAIEAQRAAEEEERNREEEQKELEEQVRKAAERAEFARQAELILSTIR